MQLVQVIDVAMTDGASYVALPLFKWLQPGGFLPTDEHGRLDPTQSVLHSAAPWGDVCVGALPDPIPNPSICHPTYLLSLSLSLSLSAGR